MLPEWTINNNENYNNKIYVIGGVPQPGGHETNINEGIS